MNIIYLNNKFYSSGIITNTFRVIILLSLLLSNLLLSQTVKEYIPKYSNPFEESLRWQNYPELIGRGCRSMVEDKNGTLWFGVSGGVISYDGLKWESYPIFKELSDVPVVTLCVSIDGSIYAGSTEGIAKYSLGKWSTLDFNLEFGDADQYFYNKIPIIETSDRSILIGTKKGLLRLRNNTGILYGSETSVSNLKDFELISKLETFDIYSLYEDSTNTIWMGLRDGRIFTSRLNESNLNISPQWKRLDNSPGYVRVKYPLIKKNSKGDTYVVSSLYDGGINVKKGIKWKHIKLKEKFHFDEIYTDIIELHDGNMCISGLGRIFVEKNNKWEMYESPTFPFSSNRLVLYQTNDQSLWIIGLSNEVWKIDLSNQKWATLLGLSFQTEDQNGNYWYITYDDKIVQYNVSASKWLQYDKTNDVIDYPVAITTTKSGRIWIAGSHQEKAATAFLDGSKWIQQLHPNLGWCIDRRALFEADDNSLWFGSSTDFIQEKGQKGGLVRYREIDYNNPANIVFEYHHQKWDFTLGAIYGIGQSKDGLIWAGQHGFYNYDMEKEQWNRITDPPGLNNSFIDYLDTSPGGDLWVGTRTNGVFWLNSKDKKWHNFTKENGLSSNAIINIFAEDDSSVWVSTDRDISHFDGTDWVTKVFTGYFRNIRDGISIHKTSNGSLWINQNPPMWFRRSLYNEDLTKDFLNQFKTIKYLPDDEAPETEITFYQERISQPGNVIISWIGNDPWKSTPSTEVQYSYRIDKAPWSSFTFNTNNIFLDVKEGEHIFEVRARDMDFNVDKSPALVSFYVVPPTWKQTWFILLILTFLSIITFFIIFLFRRNKFIEEISETKVRLFANISHELRTPLVLILGPLSKILESPLLDKQLHKPLMMVNRNSHRLLRLVNQVLDFRKMEAGQLKFKPSQGDIIAFIKEEVSVFEEAAEAKNISLKFISNYKNINMWFDFDKIEKIIFNILANALKYTPENGEISVSVKTDVQFKMQTINLKDSNVVKFNKLLKIEIRDSGIGIDKRNLEKIFDRFYQVSEHSKTAVGGTGIGLAVAKEMVKIHHGKISVQSEVGKGTLFNIQIPLIEAISSDESNSDQDVSKQTDYIKFKYPEKEESDSNEESVLDKKNEEDKNTVLVVEDNLDMREYIKAELQNYYCVLTAKNGVEGFEKAINNKPDLIISDIMMPQMDGIEFCKKIKTDERTSHMALLLLTARSSIEHKIEGLETGADDYLTKPFVSDELRLRINNIIESRKKYREQFGKSFDIEPSDLKITSIDQKFIKDAIRIIEENISDTDFDVAKFSHLIGISRVGLYNKLKVLTNYSVQEFIYVIKLKRAAQMLRKSGMSVTEITYEVGFKDPSHFSKLFKKQFGLSPKIYKKENGKKSN